MATNWMLLVGILVTLFIGLAVKTYQVLILSASLAVTLAVIWSGDELVRVMWAGLGVICAYLAVKIGLSGERKNKDDY